MRICNHPIVFEGSGMMLNDFDNDLQYKKRGGFYADATILKARNCRFPSSAESSGFVVMVTSSHESSPSSSLGKGTDSSCYS